MGFKSLLGIKKHQWKKTVNKYIVKTKTAFPQYPWDDFYRITEYFQGRGLSSLPERAFLFRLCHDLRANAKIVEIGSWIGESSCLLASGLKGEDAKLYAIDNFKGQASDPSARMRYQERMSRLKINNTKEIFDKNIAHFNLSSKVEAIAADSLEAAKSFREPLHSIDLLFIDGDHSEDATRKDITTWMPFLKQGGTVVFHDFSSNHGVPQAIWWAIQQSYFSGLVGIYGTMIAFRASESITK